MRVGFVLAALALALHACLHGPATPESAWSVQLHLHGSFSEGLGSIDSHGYEARSVGCDVLWWSDHDFRITTYQHVSRFGFEDWEEPLDRSEPWTRSFAKHAGDSKRLRQLKRPERARARFLESPVKEGERSLRVTSAGAGPEFESHLLLLGAARRLERRSLASGVTLRIALFPEDLGPDARAVVDVQLSEHAPREGLGLVPYVVRYEIAPGSPGEPRREGEAYVVPVRCELGRWNELALELSADAVRGFPEFPGQDNVLYRLVVGVEARKDARASACFDDLRIDQEFSGPSMYARQRELIGEVAKLHPGLVQLQGVEVSYDSPHLNVFCADTPLVDYADIARDVPNDPENPALVDARAFSEEILRRVVSETHARGGLVSYNHPFGSTYEGSGKVRTNEQELELLLSDRAAGADLLEVGYRDRGGATLDDHLYVWDQAALRGLRLVGVGASDSHGGPGERWRGSTNNFVSWIYARTPGKEELIEGLRAGRVFFGDIERFDGELDLVTDEGQRMGATVVTDRTSVELELRASGVEPGERIVLVESGARTTTFEVTGHEFRVKHVLQLPEPGPALARFEVHDETGPIALSNPIHFLRE